MHRILLEYSRFVGGDLEMSGGLIGRRFGVPGGWPWRYVPSRMKDVVWVVGPLEIEQAFIVWPKCKWNALRFTLVQHVDVPALESIRRKGARGLPRPPHVSLIFAW